MYAVKGLVVAAVVALLGTVVPAAGATLLINGSFETGVPGNTRGMTNSALFGSLPTATGKQPNWDTWGGLNGWTLATGSGIAVQTAGTVNKISPHTGKYYVALDAVSNTKLTQDVALKAGTYTLKLWYNFDQGTVTTNSMTFGITKNGLPVANSTYIPLVTTRKSWTLVSMNFRVRSAGTYQVYIGGTGSSDGKGGFIDDVDLSQVPIPAAGFGLIGALAALGALKRRRRTA